MAGAPLKKDKVAIKFQEKSRISKQDNGLKNLIGEIRVHWSLERCDGVMKLLAIYEDASFIQLVLEYQPKGSLMQTLIQEKQYSEADVRMIMEQGLLALDYMQEKKVLHRDIKPDNILLHSILGENDCEIKIADLGLAVFTERDEKLFHKCGTPGYVAPEIFKDLGYSYKADIFSMGSVFFNLLTGCYLFSGKDQAEVLRLNFQCKLDHMRHFLKGVSPQCQDLLHKMLKVDPNERPSAKEALSHPWFSQDLKILKELLFMNSVVGSNDRVQGETTFNPINGSRSMS